MPRAIQRVLALLLVFGFAGASVATSCQAAVPVNGRLALLVPQPEADEATTVPENASLYVAHTPATGAPHATALVAGSAQELSAEQVEPGNIQASTELYEIDVSTLPLNQAAPLNISFREWSYSYTLQRVNLRDESPPIFEGDLVVTWTPPVEEEGEWPPCIGEMQLDFPPSSDDYAVAYLVVYEEADDGARFPLLSLHPELEHVALDDERVLASGEHCYRLAAIDVAGNETVSDEECATVNIPEGCDNRP